MYVHIYIYHTHICVCVCIICIYIYIEREIYMYTHVCTCSIVEYWLQLSMCAGHPCSRAVLVFSVSFQVKRMIPEGNATSMSFCVMLLRCVVI